MNSQSAVGKEALAYCTSCKMDLIHIVAAMTGDRIVRAQCRTCKKEHAYKAPKGVKDPTKAPPKKATATRARKTAAAKAKPIEEEWQTLMKTHAAQPAKSYSSKTHFAAGDKIRHSSFGEGVIQKLIHPNKIEVVFQMDLKVLIHAPAPTL